MTLWATPSNILINDDGAKATIHNPDGSSRTIARQIPESN
jgi:hypothetical protein